MAKAQNILLRAYIIILHIINNLVSIIRTKILTPWNNNNTSLLYQTLPLEISTKLSIDTTSIKTASSDFGKLVHDPPAFVFHPTTVSDIVHLVKSSYTACPPFKIAARGHSHSIGGQATVKDGVVVEMSSLVDGGIKVCWSESLGFYCDVGGGQLWIDVLRTTMEHGLAPVSWTDYLYLSVGGTLSNAGISGQAFLHGPQISNVLEMNVITGKGDFITCSKNMNSDLFYGVLGGLGQFGIITRARIVLQKAPTRVKWIRMIYEDFVTFTKDQEHLISLNHGPNYVEGYLIMKKSPANNWRSSFFSVDDEAKVNALASEYGVVYSLEVVKYYDNFDIPKTDEELNEMFKGLNFKTGYIFKKDATFIDFLNRVRTEELKLQSKGLWDIHHPWLNFFIPKSCILEFNQRVFIDIIQRENKSAGPFLVYPMNRKKWDYRMSSVISDEDEGEDVFYTVGLLPSARNGEDLTTIENQNKRILKLCDEIGINIKQYLPRYYETKEEWMMHFGVQWGLFEERKAKYDPKMILSPGQKIFNFSY
ncbi:cytokinin dehydrogenase 3-like [Bidens hawaiensis]|uniref:cytokinin dehydrogenase 3-like n=1 Tax=Bidens hawaiensis TaxID=980011 RepID=UPI004049CF51